MLVCVFIFVAWFSKFSGKFSNCVSLYLRFCLCQICLCVSWVFPYGFTYHGSCCTLYIYILAAAHPGSCSLYCVMCYLVTGSVTSFTSCLCSCILTLTASCPCLSLSLFFPSLILYIIIAPFVCVCVCVCVCGVFYPHFSLPFPAMHSSHTQVSYTT